MFAPLLQMMWEEALAHLSLSNALFLTFVRKEGYWLMSCTTQSMEQRFTWTADIRSTIKENPYLWKKPKVHYHDHNSPPLDFQRVSESPTRHMHLLHGYNFYKNPRARLVTRGVSFAPRMQNIEATLQNLFARVQPGTRYLCTPVSSYLYISTVPFRFPDRNFVFIWRSGDRAS